jgi:6-phosphogluconate dehydrogenase
VEKAFNFEPGARFATVVHFFFYRITFMQLGMIGLGRMGANMAKRLANGGHEVIGYDPVEAARKTYETGGQKSAASLQEMLGMLPDQKIVWMMVPAGKPVDETIALLASEMKPGDIIIDGGNSNYKDTMRRAADLKSKQISYVDCGTSGGVWGLDEGYSMMIGGDEQVVAGLNPIFQTLAPDANKGWGRVGPCGSGHFVKMVHNGVEYGMMQSFAEGFSILEHKEEFGLDVHQIAEIWRFGSVVRAWLLDLIALALEQDPGLNDLEPFVDDSGEGRWTTTEALDLNVPAPVITLSLIERIRSREQNSFGDRLLAAMRHQFGGHAVKKK